MRPQPTDAFEWVQAAAGPALACRPLKAVAHHLYTTRTWRLGSGRREDADPAWAEVAEAFEVDSRRLVRVRQVHGRALFVRRRGEPHDPSVLVEADIIVSNDPSVAIVVRAADCVPLLIADARTGVVAAVHAGWRGMALGVAAAAVRALTREFGAAPADLVAAVGPSIGACCYEVGDDLRQRFIDAGWPAAQIDSWFSRQPPCWPRNKTMAGVPSSGRDGHWFFNGWRAVRHQLEAVSVPSAQIHIAELCTASHPEEFCSYRRDGAAAGRLVGAIRARS